MKVIRVEPVLVYQRLLRTVRAVEDASYSDIEGGPNNCNASLKEQLAWQVENQMHHIHWDKLLRILKRFHPELFISARTSVQTDRNIVQLLAVQPGYYRHFGIKNGVLRLLTQFGGQQIIRRLPNMLPLTILN